MTPRRRRFVEAYAGNATQAAIAAGFSARTATSAGQRLLTIPEVSEAIQAREDQRLSALVADRTERQVFWTATMRDECQRTCDRLRASELLAKASGDFLERVELTKLEPPIINVIFGNDEEEE